MAAPLRRRRLTPEEREADLEPAPDAAESGEETLASFPQRADRGLLPLEPRPEPDRKARARRAEGAQQGVMGEGVVAGQGAITVPLRRPEADRPVFDPTERPAAQAGASGRGR